MKSKQEATKAPKTPSPKRVRGHGGLTNSPASSTTSTESNRLPHLSSSKESSTKEQEGKEVTTSSKNKTSLLTSAVIFVFCAGLVFFTLESVRYASTVSTLGRFAAIFTEGDPPAVLNPPVTRFFEETPKASTTIPSVANEPKKAKMKTGSQSATITRAPTKTHTKRKVVSTRARAQIKARGLANEKTKVGRRLSKGRTRRGGGMMGMGRGATNFRNDLLFLNGGFVPGPAPMVETTPQLQMIMTNVQILQPGIGFLPQGATLILAPGPRRMRGMGMMGSKGNRKRFPDFTPFPTPLPTPRPTPVPSSQPSSAAEVPSSSPSRGPSRQPSSTPSNQPSLSKAPSRQPSTSPSSNPSTAASLI